MIIIVKEFPSTVNQRSVRIFQYLLLWFPDIFKVIFADKQLVRLNVLYPIVWTLRWVWKLKYKPTVHKAFVVLYLFKTSCSLKNNFFQVFPDVAWCFLSIVYILFVPCMSWPSCFLTCCEFDCKSVVSVLSVATHKSFKWRVWRILQSFV